MSKKTPTLIIPIENQVRELDSKLLIACCAAEKGFPIILGSQFFIYLAMPKLPLGVVFAKSMRSVNGATFSLMNQLGYDIVACDEEGLVRFDSPEYYEWRYSKATFAAISHLFAWGKDDAKAYSNYKGYTGIPIHLTGNSRIDLLRPELRGIFQQKVDEIQAKYGDFILINTNFSFVNNFVDNLNLIQRDHKGSFIKISRSGSGLSKQFAEGMENHQKLIYTSFKKLLPELSKRFPNNQFILRPHPSENHAVWRDLLKGIDNIQVVHEGNVAPWLMASQGLLHNGCTTAVEATVLGTPSITYQPIHAEMYDYHLPNSLSHEATTPEQVFEGISAVIQGKIGLISEQTKNKLFEKHLSSTNGTLAADKIVDVLLNAGYLTNPPNKRSKLNTASGWLGMTGRGIIQRLKMLNPNHRTHIKYHNHQFPTISKEEINLRIKTLGKNLNRFSDIHAEFLSPYVFRISKKSDDNELHNK
ncbi:MAG: hypothetical protein LM517_10220 [Nitrosomonas sp.]|nr:hypothetical protein [Nitrosomonas sp.]